MVWRAGSVGCGVLVALLGGATGCNAIGRARLESKIASEAAGCRVKFERGGRSLKLSPCDDGETTERGRRWVMDHCADIRALDVGGITVETWNAPRYRSYHWDSSENDRCSMRCIGSGC
jgi:hypothetical protein